MNKTIKELADEFLEYKHNIGYQYQSSETYLRGFVQFILQKHPNAVVPDKEYIQDFIDTKKQNSGALYGTIAVLREFCRYLVSQGYENIYVIPSKRSPKLYPVPPYFFTKTEISDFFHEADSIVPHASFKGREYVIPALFRILYCCGLRCKEARMLRCEEVHLDKGYFDIFQSKGLKSRRIFITSELTNYLVEYEYHIEEIFPERIYFFPHTGSKGYGSGFITQNFRYLWLRAYPDFEKTFKRPRAYDFRHHFVWANLNRWAEEGKDVNAWLPYISKYMGHQHLNNTLYYFRFVPEFFTTYTKLASNLEKLLPEVPYEKY